MDDEEDLREAVAEYLGGRGFRVLAVGDAAAFRTLAAREAFDVVVLDVAMPGEDGLSLARWLRGRGPRPGIVLATAAGSQRDRVVGLEIGADDYVVKPYDLRELLARVRAVLRRLPDHPSPAPRAPGGEARGLRVGASTFDPGSHRLTGPAGDAVELTAAEAGLLVALVTRPNRILSRGQLLDLADGREADGGERSVDVRVTRLRRKIEADPARPRLIRTVRGEGYVFVPDGGSERAHDERPDAGSDP